MFSQTEVSYHGVLVNRDGFRPDPEKISLIVNGPVAHNLKQLRRFFRYGIVVQEILKRLCHPS